MGRHAIDITGRRFGRLVVLRRESIDAHWNPTWLCQCDCGKTAIVTGHALRQGETRSCGCLRIEYIRKYGRHQPVEHTKEDMVRALSQLGYLRAVGLTYKTARKADLELIRRLFETKVKGNETGVGQQEASGQE